MPASDRATGHSVVQGRDPGPVPPGGAASIDEDAAAVGGTTVIVHDRSHVRAALTAAAESGIAITLRTAPAAVASLDPASFLDMIETTAAAVPGARYQVVVDCGGYPGLALAALNAGCRRLSVRLPEPLLARLSDIASASGAVVVAAADEPALDLLNERDCLARCRKWFATGAKSTVAVGNASCQS